LLFYERWSFGLDEGAMRTPLTPSNLLLLISLVAPASALATESSDLQIKVPLVAVASETKRDWGDPLITVVRVAFAKDRDRWRAFPDSSYDHEANEGPRTTVPRPHAARWNVCLDGRRRGSVSTQAAGDLGAIALANVHTLAPGERTPLFGKKTTAFGGWMGTPVHRPLILVSSDACSDPDKWMPQPFPAAQLDRVLPAFREAVRGISGCEADGRAAGPYDFPPNEVIVGQSYASRRGDRLVTLSVRQSKEVVGSCDGPLGEEWSPHTFAVLADGTVRHLGSSLQLLDAGDYDGDGKSEIVFQFGRYDYDGYTMFSNRFEESVTFGWIYH
jgi:hypothetical protein